VVTSFQQRLLEEYDLLEKKKTRVFQYDPETKCQRLYSLLSARNARILKSKMKTTLICFYIKEIIHYEPAKKVLRFQLQT